MPRRARVTSIVLACIVALATPPSADAQAPSAAASLDGSVSLPGIAVRVAGVDVTVLDRDGMQVAHRLTDAEGRFRILDLPAGRYRIIVSLEGFKATEAQAAVAAGATTTIAIELTLAAIAEQVDVVAPAVVGSRETLGMSEVITGKESEQFTPGGGVQAALRLLASVIQSREGVSIKGGRPNQASIQLGTGTLVDPSTGLVPLELPPDAIDSVEVLPNPYTVEFGRFSSGLVVIQTRRASDRWRTRLNNLDPGFRTDRENNLKIIGLGVFAPRVEIGGPLVKDRLSVQQTAQYRYTASDVPSRPQSDVRLDHWLSTFTRLDATVSASHSLVATGGLFPRHADYVTLGTFVPPDASVNLRERIGHGAVTERATWNDTFFSESTVRAQGFRTDVEPRGSDPMRLQPETTLGSFFNRQSRNARTYQWVTTVSATREGAGALHLIKFGVDLLHSAYTGSSASRPVLVEDSNGALVRRLDFEGRSAQDAPSTDVASFVQDRIAPNRRWSIELGGRIDRDGILGRLNLTPRAGAAVLLTESGSALLRGGFGLFYERTPSVAGTFEQFENWRDTRFDVVPAGLTSQFVHAVSPDLRTARSATWNLTYDHQLNASLSIHAGVLDRRGRHELVVGPLADSDTAASAVLLLQSNGRSSYREAEAGVHLVRGSALDLQATYVRSVARGDLNSFTSFFGAMLSPIVGANGYGPLGSDVPRRVFAHGRVSPTARWLVLGIADWRTGFPYSRVNQTLDFVEPRNRDRFPNAFRLELGVERRLKLGRWEPWIGVRATNALKSFLPTDVQANVASAAFGTFYNSEFRQFRLLVRFAE